MRLNIRNAQCACQKIERNFQWIAAVEKCLLWTKVDVNAAKAVPISDLLR